MEATEVAVKGRRFQVVWFVSDSWTYCVISEEERGAIHWGAACRNKDDKHDPQIAMRESARDTVEIVKSDKLRKQLWHEIREYLRQKLTADGWRVTIPITGEFTYSPTYFPLITSVYNDVEDTTRILR